MSSHTFTEPRLFKKFERHLRIGFRLLCWSLVLSVHLWSYVFDLSTRWGKPWGLKVRMVWRVSSTFVL